MKNPTAIFLLAWLAPACSLGPEEVEPPRPRPGTGINADDLMRHVEHLASDELEGRASNAPGGRAAAEYVAARFADFGMESFGDDYFLPLGDEDLSPNVVAFVRGQGPGYYLVTAHYDHLGVRGDSGDTIFNGADDNASGTAAVIELARAFSACANDLRVSVAFAAFSAEEMGLRGSRHFVENPPFALDELRGVINTDMIGRGEEDLVFCEGADEAPALEAAIQRANQRIGLRIRCGEHPEWIPASDHFPFMQKGVPAIYLGVEDHPDYHRASDHADKVLPLLIERVTKLVCWTIYDLAGPPGPHR